MGNVKLAVEPDRAAYTRAEGKPADVLMRYDHVWVMTDDIYEHIVYDGFTFSTIAEIEPGLKERTATLNGVAKAFSMTGWRVGYSAAPVELTGHEQDPKPEHVAHEFNLCSCDCRLNGPGLPGSPEIRFLWNGVILWSLCSIKLTALTA